MRDLQHKNGFTALEESEHWEATDVHDIQIYVILLPMCWNYLEALELGG